MKANMYEQMKFPRPGQGTTPKNARYMSNVQDLFWCDARGKKGGLVQAPECNQHECFLVQGNKQETNPDVMGVIGHRQSQDTVESREHHILFLLP